MFTASDKKSESDAERNPKKLLTKISVASWQVGVGDFLPDMRSPSIKYWRPAEAHCIVDACLPGWRDW